MRLSRVALVVTTVIPLAVLAAKPSIIRFSPPTPDNYGVEKFWNLTLDNPDGSTYDTVWLEGYIFEATAGEVFRAITYEFELPPGQMRIQYADIKRIGLKNIEYAEGYAEFAGRYGGLPPGAYSFEIRLMPDFDTVQPDPIVVRPMGPPRLILPRDGDTIRVKYPRFSWTPPGPPPSGPVAYTLQVFEVLPEQTKEEAAAANPPWFEQKDTRTTSLTYPLRARPLPDTGLFAWQVKARSSNGESATSPVWGFRYSAGGLFPPPDMWMKDTPDDDGTEPNPDAGPMWVSEDIWVRNTDDGGLEHQNPMWPYENTIYVRVRNRQLQSGSGTVKVYWAKAACGLAWPDNWVGCMQYGLPYGDLVGEAQFTDVAYMQEKVLPVQWLVPRPTDYPAGDDQAHFCLLARIECTPDPIQSEGADVYTNTRNSNNIAWKNVTLVEDVIVGGTNLKSCVVLVRNTNKRAPRPTSISFELPSKVPAESTLKDLRVTIEIPGELARAWQAGGRHAEGLAVRGDSSFELTERQGTLSGVLLPPGKSYPVRVSFRPRRDTLPPREYYVDIVQYGPGSRTPQGGVRALLKGGAVLLPWATSATIVWQHCPPGSQGWEIWFCDFSNITSPLVSQPALLSNLPAVNMDPAIAFDRQGNTWCVWAHRGPSPGQHYSIVWSRRLTGQNTWSAPQVVAPPSPIGTDQVDPAIAFDDNGNGLCVWVEGTITNNSDQMFLRASVWDGSGWSIASQPGPNNACRLPEITFTSAPATGQTPHQAVVIAALQNPADRMGWWAWNGTTWSGCNVLPTNGGVVSEPYSGYISASPTPARSRVAIAALHKYGKPIVTAAWTRVTPTATIRLMACNGYFSAGAWTWTEFPNWFNGPNGTSYHDPAVANDGAGLSQSVFVQSDRVFAKNGFGSCQAITPPPTGRGGFLPRVAWSKGADAQHSGPLAVWWYGTDICWAFRNGSGVWNDPPAVALPGSDLNPDVAATSGSHTMPVHAAAPGTQVPAKTWEDYAAPYRNLSIANPRNPYDFVGIVHNAGLDYLRESLAPPVKEGDDTLVGSLRSFFEMKLREDKADTTDYRPAIENLRKDGISTGSFEEELAALTRNPRLRDTVRFNPLMYLRMVDKMCASYATREMDYEGLQGQLRKLEEEVIGDPGESGFGKELVLGGLAIAKYSFQYLDANGIGAERESLQASVGGADRKGWMKGENNTGFLEAVGRATAASAKELWHKAKEWLTQ